MNSPSDRFRPRAARKPVASPSSAPFASFLERHEERTRKSRNKRRMFVISIAVHVVVFGLLILVSAWKVDELFGPSVEVKVMGAGDGDNGADGKPRSRPRLNVSRAVGLRLVVTPQGARTEPRGDLEPAPPEVRQDLQALLTQQLLPLLHYPHPAKDVRLRGAVTLLVDVDDAGKATAVTVKQPCLHPVLCNAAQEAVAKVSGWPSVHGSDALSVPVEYRYAP